MRVRSPQNFLNTYLTTSLATSLTRPIPTLMRVVAIASAFAACRVDTSPIAESRDASTLLESGLAETAIAPDAGDSGAPLPTGELRVLYDAESPLSTLTTGRVALAADGMSLVGATPKGIAILNLDGTPQAQFALPPQNQAPAVSAIATRLGSPDILFMTQGFDGAGDGTIGSVDTATKTIQQRSALLGTILGDVLIAPVIAGLADAVWTVDPGANPPAVHAYTYASRSAGADAGPWQPDALRSVPLPKLDLDRNGRDDVVIPTNMALVSAKVGFVTFALAPGPANTSGGIFFFDPSTAAPLAIMLIPARMGATTGTVMDALISADRLFVLSDEGSTDAKYNFTRIQGTVSVYDLALGTGLPAAADLNPRVAMPKAQFATSTNHPVALQEFGGSVIAMTFPQNLPAALDILESSGTGVRKSLSLGVLNNGKSREPRRMVASATRLYLGTDRGLIVAGTQ
jgi:hypothetical protein